MSKISTEQIIKNLCNDKDIEYDEYLIILNNIISPKFVINKNEIVEKLLKLPYKKFYIPEIAEYLKTSDKEKYKNYLEKIKEQKITQPKKSDKNVNNIRNQNLSKQKNKKKLDSKKRLKIEKKTEKRLKLREIRKENKTKQFENYIKRKNEKITYRKKVDEMMKKINRND